MQSNRWPIRLWQNPGEVEPIPNTIVKRDVDALVKVKSAKSFTFDEIANIQNLQASFVADHLFKFANYTQSPQIEVTQGGGALAPSPVSSLSVRPNGALIASCVGFTSSASPRGYVFTLPSITSANPWTQTPLTEFYLHVLSSRIGATDYTLLVGNNNSVARSTNGTSFTETVIPSTIANHGLNAIAYANGVWITGGGVASGSNYVAETFVTPDNGAGWIALNPILNATVTAIAYSEVRNRFIAHITMHGAYSADSGFYTRPVNAVPGDNWQPLATGQQFFTSNRSTDLAIVGTRIVSSIGQVSFNSGDTWESVQTVNGGSNHPTNVRDGGGFFAGAYDSSGGFGLAISVDGKTFFNIASNYVPSLPSTEKFIQGVFNGDIYGATSTRRIFSMKPKDYDYVSAIRYLDNLR